MTIAAAGARRRGALRVLFCFCFAFAVSMLFRAANGLMAPELMRELDIAPARM